MYKKTVISLFLISRLYTAELPFDINEQNARGRTALHRVADSASLLKPPSQESLDAFKALYPDKTPSEISQRARDKSGLDLVHAMETALLVLNGADVNKADHAGITPLTLGEIYQDDFPLIDKVLQWGAARNHDAIKAFLMEGEQCKKFMPLFFGESDVDQLVPQKFGSKITFKSKLPDTPTQLPPRTSARTMLPRQSRAIPVTLTPVQGSIPPHEYTRERLKVATSVAPSDPRKSRFTQEYLESLTPEQLDDLSRRFPRTTNGRIIVKLEPVNLDEHLSLDAASIRTIDMDRALTSIILSLNGIPLDTPLVEAEQHQEHFPHLHQVLKADAQKDEQAVRELLKNSEIEAEILQRFARELHDDPLSGKRLVTRFDKELKDLSAQELYVLHATNSRINPLIFSKNNRH